MSANIYWEPTKSGRYLRVGCPSAVTKQIEEAFGMFPVTLTLPNLAKLSGMATVDKDSYELLVDALTEHESIRIWVEY